jgi:hypothetical protein
MKKAFTITKPCKFKLKYSLANGTHGSLNTNGTFQFLLCSTENAQTVSALKTVSTYGKTSVEINCLADSTMIGRDVYFGFKWAGSSADNY